MLKITLSLKLEVVGLLSREKRLRLRTVEEEEEICLLSSNEKRNELDNEHKLGQDKTAAVGGSETIFYERKQIRAKQIDLRNFNHVFLISEHESKGNL